MWLLLLVSAHTLLVMRCAHPESYVPQWLPDATSGNNVR